MTRLRLLSLAAACALMTPLCAFPTPGHAQSAPSGMPQVQAPAGVPGMQGPNGPGENWRAERRERWSQLTPAQKQQLEQIHQQLRALHHQTEQVLNPSQRQQLQQIRQQVRALRAQEAQILGFQPPSPRGGEPDLE